MMATYTVNLMVVSYGVTEVEAESLGEAYVLAQELAAGDFSFVDGSDEWREVVEVR